MGFPGFASGKGPACHSRRLKRCGFDPFQEDPLEEDMATHSSVLAWRISWTEEPGRLQSLGLQRVEHKRSNIPCMHSWAMMKLLSVTCSSMSLLVFLS